MTKENHLSLIRFCGMALNIIDGKVRAPDWWSWERGLCTNYYVSPYYCFADLKTLAQWDSEYPFGDYYTNGDKVNGTIYSNPQRLAFLKEWAAKPLK